ncbi:uncharacterized protein SETTUDRAFT_28065 [Exserohilum turcica Et28A]|uniref:Uncharacterized protein n=1 Tax=Exserohilum turcicum (strain 28A) TaxID=671987 RepID=R0KEL3_EXST2|nr:uncharacterized protein SETTUDRAFT_28065 [Exserohilum turcica Et28A]EOA87764.1 hypothetical protein SETTUDRAFT_28065 [Exserohilum turcica Et28A]
MTTSILTPLNNSPFGVPDSYPRTISTMSRGQGYFFHNFNPDDATGSNSYNFQHPQPQSTEHAFSNVWGTSPLTTAPPQDTHHAFVSQPSVNASPTSTASIDPAALSTPTFTPANASASFSTPTFTSANSSVALATPNFTPANSSAGFHHHAAAISPSQSHFDTNLSSSSPLGNETSCLVSLHGFINCINRHESIIRMTV